MPDPYKPVTRILPGKVTLSNIQFARWVSKRYGVSSVAMSRATRLLIEGMIDALAEGYSVQLKGLGKFEARELAPRMRFNRTQGVRYLSKPSVILHFKKSEKLNDTLRTRAKEKLDALSSNPTVVPSEKR